MNQSSYEQDDFVKVDTLIRSAIKGAILKEQHANMLQYQLPAKNIKLADVFSIIEDNRTGYKIMDYSVRLLDFLKIYWK